MWVTKGTREVREIWIKNEGDSFKGRIIWVKLSKEK